MAIGLLLVAGPEMALEISGLVVLLLPDTEAGFLIMTFGEVGLIILMMTTGEGTNLIGQCQWIGVIETEEGITFLMIEKGLRGGYLLHLCRHRHHHHHYHFLINVVDGGGM